MQPRPCSNLLILLWTSFACRAVCQCQSAAILFVSSADCNTDTTAAVLWQFGDCVSPVVVTQYHQQLVAKPWNHPQNKYATVSLKTQHLHVVSLVYLFIYLSIYLIWIIIIIFIFQRAIKINNRTNIENKIARWRAARKANKNAHHSWLPTINLDVGLLKSVKLQVNSTQTHTQTKMANM